MSVYRVELMRKASATKALYQPVRDFSFEADDDVKAIQLAECMHIFPEVDDCDIAVLVARGGKYLWSDWRHG